MCMLYMFFFKQKAAYEVRISDWSSDVCSSDLFVAALQRFDTIFIFRVDALDRLVILRLDRFQRGLRPVLDDGELPPVGPVEIDQFLLGQHLALLHALRPRAGGLADQQFLEAGEGRAVEDRTFVFGILLQPLDLFTFDRDRALVLVDAVAVENADLDHRAGHARRQAQRRVAHVARLFAKDGAQQLFFRRHRAFALRRDLADQYVARPDLGADIDDARLVEVAQRFLADVRDVAGDVLRPKPRIARGDLELLDVDRGEDVVLHDAFADEDTIFVVIAVPRHERDEDVLAQRQFAQLGRRAVGDDVAGADRVAHFHQRTLVDAGVLVRSLEFLQAIDKIGRAHV